MRRPGFPKTPWWMHLYAQLLRTFPREFRDRWGADMRLAFADRVRHAQTAHGGTPWTLIARELRILLAAGITERLHTSTPLPHMLHAQDIRYAFRLLARSPGFSLLTVLVLAGGLGLSTFTFSFLYTGMMRPLPLSEGDRIVRLTRVQEGTRRTQVDAVDVRMLRESMRTVHELGAYTKREVIVGREGDRRVLTATVTDPILFKVARTPAFIGRSLVPSDAEPGAEPVMVLSYRTWNVAFAGERNVVDTHVTINGVSTRIVGVMPEGFGFPVAQDAWTPLASTMGAAAQVGSEYLSMFGRLAPGVTHAQAAAEATSLLQAALVARDTAEQVAARIGMVVESFPAAQIGDERTLAFTFMNVCAALILLLALVNAATLLSARANERVCETAVRMALGASGGRLVMQGMWEGIILCLIAGVVGTAGVAWGLDAITSWTQAKMPDNLAFWWVWRMDTVTLLAAGAFVTVAIAVLGSVVSVRAARTNVCEVMQDTGARGGSRREGRLARVLVAMQVTAVTVLMFVGVLSGVMARRVVTIDPGYDPTNLLQAALIPDRDRFATAEARHEVYRLIQTGLAEHRALDRAMLQHQIADARGERGRFATLDTRASASPLPTAHILATSGTMSTLGIELVEGREFTVSDDRSRAPVAVISQSLATRHWRGASPVGTQVRLAGVGDTLRWRTIVGVVSDIPYGDPLSRDRTPDAIYVPVLQTDVPWVNVTAHHAASEIAGRQALHDVFGAVDPLLVPGYVYRAQEVIDQVGLITIGMTKLFGSCFAFALLLAVAGTYGLMSRSIGLRTREIGVRRALGASDAMATRMLLAQGARQLGVGTAVAAPIIAVVGAASMQFLPLGAMLTATAGVLVSAAIIAVVLAATWVPTRKVLRVPLRDALWNECPLEIRV